MADKNITLRQKNTSGVYDKLYTKTTATQSKLSAATAALFGDGTSDADAALAKIADTVKAIGDVQVKVVDPSGNPIQGARITGLYGTPTTASDGTAHGVLQTNPISISSPYIDLKDQTADASGYVGSFNVLTVTLPIVGENAITRITSSKTVKFSKSVKTVDICCVGGGGGGGSAVGFISYANGSGGGGGGIVNSMSYTITPNTSYQILIGAGGASGPDQRGISQITDGSGKNGGVTSFNNIVSAIGGEGGVNIYNSSSDTSTYRGGVAGVSGCGDGGWNQNGGSNTTISEFLDGVTFYSGGGAGGRQGNLTAFSGGTPNGADGAYSKQYEGTGSGNALLPKGPGGGGGGGVYSTSQLYGQPSAGASGLVAIRFHF